MGDKTREENDRELEELGITLWGNAFRVAVIEIEDYRDVHSLDDKKKQERALIAFVVYNVSQEIVENTARERYSRGRSTARSSCWRAISRWSSAGKAGPLRRRSTDG